MYAPIDVCKSLYKLHPYLRLGWMGKKQSYEGELNPGAFVLCQLYHISDIGSLDEPNVFNDLWDIGYKLDEAANLMVRGKIDRGPLFSKDGSSRRDWDPLFRIPVWVMTIDENWEAYDGEKFKPEDVSNGRFIATVKKWLYTSAQERVAVSKQERVKKLDTFVDGTIDEMTDRLWFEANKTEATGPRMAKKHIAEDDIVKSLPQKAGKSLAAKVF